MRPMFLVLISRSENAGTGLYRPSNIGTDFRNSSSQSCTRLDKDADVPVLLWGRCPRSSLEAIYGLSELRGSDCLMHFELKLFVSNSAHLLCQILLRLNYMSNFLKEAE